MRSRFRPVMILGLLAVASTLGTARGVDAPVPSLVPLPLHYEGAAGAFVLTGQTVLVTEEATRPVGQYFADLVAPALGQKLSVTDHADGPAITMLLSPGLNRLGSEGYTLVIAPTRIDIRAAGPAGIFYACQTLRQMLPPALESHTKLDGPLTLSACTIEDQPRYAWRGMHLDVSRHFFSKESVERYIDLLSQYKMNVFHWHLTDDQGWRIEIKKYPQLTSKSAWRPYGPTEAGIPAPASQPDGSPGLYGGFYTQDDIREVVAYAKARFVNVVPEIEMPGHALAALSAYPEFSCTGGPFTVGAPWGVFKEVYCPGKEATFTFIENVLDEVCDLFPGPYIHIGGDECPKDRWKACPDCQARMKAEGLKNEDELQSYFVKRIEKFLETRHHRLIGWNEILQGGLAPGATVTSWQGMSGGRFAASQGHDVIMCPESNCYFDHTQEIGSNTHNASSFLFESPVTLPKVYAFEPTPPDLTPEQARHILGAQGNVWSERIPTQDRLDTMAFPRAIALAECLWSHGSDYPGFARRLSDNFQRLDAMHVHYFHDPLAQATLLATWSPQDNIPKTRKEIDFPLAAPLAAGRYTVRFEFLSGRGHLDIDSVSLLENGQEVARDTHPGHAGQGAEANGYVVSLEHSPVEGGAYTVRAAVRSEEGSNTHGQIFLYPTPATP